MPATSNVSLVPIYEIDPPDLPEGYHSFDNPDCVNLMPYQGPYGSKVTLPRLLPPHLRVFTVPRKYTTKRSAHRHAAFEAYLAMYKEGMLNVHLLPIDFPGHEQEEEVKLLLKDVEKRAGEANVPLQMDPWAPTGDDCVWYTTEIIIEGLPPLHMMTRSQPRSLVEQECPTLFYPGRGSLSVRFRILDAHPSDERIAHAREYTRRILWTAYGNSMKWDNLDFAYLFLPATISPDPVWDSRRQWAHDMNLQLDTPRPGGMFSANAHMFGINFDFPPDLTSVRDGYSKNKSYSFVRWRDNITQEEEEELLERYKRHGFIEEFEFDILLEVIPTPRRMAFLEPLSSDTWVAQETRLLLPQLTTVDLISHCDLQYATFLPSILRFLAVSNTAISLRDNVLVDSPLQTIPLDLLTMALTAPVAHARLNYQRLETLGDTVLKLITSIQLLAEHPYWHEGYLSKRKDHAVSNVRLAKEAIASELYRWIIRDRLILKKWKPLYLSLPPERLEPIPDPASPLEQPVPKSEHAIILKKSTKRRAPARQQLSTKVLADVVESLIGAAYIHGGLDLAVDCAEIFGLGLAWQKIPFRIQTILAHLKNAHSYPVHSYPAQITHVEQMVGYEFKHKKLLVEALNHASHHADLDVVSYERMEFLGDSALDLVVTEHLYHAPGKNYSPGHIHLRKIPVVNAQFLAFICLSCYLDLDSSMPQATGRGQFSLKTETHRIYLWQCLLHSSPSILNDQNFTFGRFQLLRQEIEDALEKGANYPWATLARLLAPKFLSDMVESVLGAVYLDSRGDMDVIRHVLGRLGIMRVLDRIARDELNVLHPISRVANFAAKRDMKVKYEFTQESGKITCLLLLNDEEKARAQDNYRGRASQREVRMQAATNAIDVLRLQEEGF
jgi:endoribonuclease Dicer